MTLYMGILEKKKVKMKKKIPKCRGYLVQTFVGDNVKNTLNMVCMTVTQLKFTFSVSLLPEKKGNC